MVLQSCKQASQFSELVSQSDTWDSQSIDTFYEAVHTFYEAVHTFCEAVHTSFKSMSMGLQFDDTFCTKEKNQIEHTHQQPPVYDVAN